MSRVYDLNTEAPIELRACLADVLAVRDSDDFPSLFTNIIGVRYSCRVAITATPLKCSAFSPVYARIFFVPRSKYARPRQFWPSGAIAAYARFKPPNENVNSAQRWL